MPVDTATHADKVVVTNGASIVEIYYFGATVTSWKLNGHERLFLSSKAILDGSKAIRGGVPLVFPQFGSGGAGQTLPQHGFARVSRWSWLGTMTDNASETTVKFGLSAAAAPPAQRTLWPHNVRLEYTVSVTRGGAALATALSVSNDEPTETVAFDALLHTYLRVDDDLAGVAVTGLRGCAFIDKVAGTQSSITEDRDAVTITGETDRVYTNVVQPHIGVRGVATSTTLDIEKDNFPDVVVWNPWLDKARAMADFGDDEYTQMVCVEVGHVHKPVLLAPGKTWTGSQTLSVV